MKMKKIAKKSITLLLSIIMILSALSITPLIVSADDVTPIQIFEVYDMAVSAGSTNVTFTLRFMGGEGPYTVVWEWRTASGSVWTTVQTRTLTDEFADSYTITSAVDVANYNGRRYRVTVTDSEGSSAVSDEAVLSVTASSGTCSAPTIVTDATPANNGTVYRNEGLQITGSQRADSNMQLYVEYGLGAADTIPDPTMASQRYTGPIVVPSTATNGQTFVIKAIVTNRTMAQSPVATFSWTVNTSVETLWDIKSDPRYAIWRDANFANDVPGLTYKHDSHPINGMPGVNGDTDYYPDFVYDKVAAVLARLSAADKTNLLNASAGKVPGAVFGTRSLLSYGIQSCALPDGPVGCSITPGSDSAVYDRRNTWYPSGMSQAATFDKELNERLGRAWGAEMAFFGVDAMLGPGLNVHRGILNGRNFEYYSEDPLLSGWTAGYVVKGMSTNNVSAQVKHFMSNQQETGRSNRPTYMTTRVLREIYGRNWEYCFQVGNPWAMMTAFNHTNGPHSAQHYDLNTTMARYEWGFTGFIGTDIGSVGSSYYNFTNGGTSAGTSANAQATRVKSGCDLMQRSSGTASVTAGATYTTQTLSQVEQDQSVKRMMYYAIKGLNFNDKQPNWGPTPQYILDLTRPAAAESGNEGVVLAQNLDLANGKPALPLAKPTGAQRILMVGANNNTRLHGGTGSGQLSMNSKDSAITPNLITAIGNVAGGSSYVTSNTSAAIADSQWTTWSGNGVNYTAVIMSISRSQGESTDVSTTNRATSAAELTLIRQASNFARAKGIPFIVVLNMCNYIDMEDWYTLADAIVIDWYQGINGGAPSARVIFNEVNPSGKLPNAVPQKTTGNYAGNGSRYYPQEGIFGTSTDIYYYEDIYNGYRYYDTFNVPQRFPFGHGLSYTKFDYSDAKLSKTTFNGVNDKITASVTITNIGDVAGKESVQFYIGAPGVEINKPVKELKEYGKTRLLEPGESQTITVEFDAMSLASYHGTGNTYNGQWRVELGHWVVYFASSSKDIRALRSFTVPASFIAKSALKPAAGQAFGTPLTNLQNANNLRTPTQITVTFNPNNGASFQKRYTYNAASYSDRAPYGYLPVPADPNFGYEWYSDQAMTTRVYESSIVPVAATTLYGKLVRTPAKITVYQGAAHASVGYTNDSAGPVKGQLFIAFYDADGKLIALESEVPAEATAAGETF